MDSFALDYVDLARQKFEELESRLPDSQNHLADWLLSQISEAEALLGREFVLDLHRRANEILNLSGGST